MPSAGGRARIAAGHRRLRRRTTSAASHDISNHDICAEARLANELVRGLIDFDVRNR